MVLMPNINIKYFIIGVVSLAILIIVGAFIFRLIKPNKSPVNQKQQIMSTAPIPTPSPKPVPVTQITGQLKDYSNKELTVTVKGKDYIYEIAPKAAYFKCKDFTSMSSCAKADQITKEAKSAIVFAKENKATMILYK